MTTHDRDKVIAAAIKAGSDRPFPTGLEFIDVTLLERFYAIAFEAGRQAERVECVQDAERYRWLRNGGDDDHGVGIYDPVIGDICFTTWNAELDEAIDNARGKAK